MTYVSATPRDRLRATLGAVALTGGLGALLLSGLASHFVAHPEAALPVFDVTPPAPPKPERLAPHRVASKRPEGKASPPNLRAEPSEIVAPKPVVPLPVPPPVNAAPIAGIGMAPSAGSADVAGPGYGAGGEGDGRGSGGAGDGDGDGGDETAPEWRSGRIKDSDYPAEAVEAGVGGTVGVRYLVGVDGRVSDCEVTQSSGNRALDAATCRLIEQRFRYRPSRDARGRPVPATIVENHEWVLRREPAEPQPERPRRRLF